MKTGKKGRPSNSIRNKRKVIAKPPVKKVDATPKTETIEDEDLETVDLETSSISDDTDMDELDSMDLEDFENEDLDSDDSDNYDPLNSERVVEKSYTKLSADIIGNMPDEIPEPVIERTQVDFNDAVIDPLEGYEGQVFSDEKEQKPERGEVKNPAWEEMTSKQKNSSAEYLAETCLNAYQLLNNLGKKWCSYGDDKRQRDALEGKFDFSILAVEISLSESGDETTTIGEYLDAINEQVGDAFTVSEEFKTNVKPLLIEIFKKKGWGLTVEQRLLALVVEDLTPKVALAFSIKSQLNQLIKIGSQMVTSQRIEREASEKAKTQPEKPVEKPEPKDEILTPEVETIENTIENFKEPS
jgi:hypothetical protein